MVTRFGSRKHFFKREQGTHLFDTPRADVKIDSAQRSRADSPCFVLFPHLISSHFFPSSLMEQIFGLIFGAEVKIE